MFIKQLLIVFSVWIPITFAERFYKASPWYPAHGGILDLLNLEFPLVLHFTGTHTHCCLFPPKCLTVLHSSVYSHALETCPHSHRWFCNSPQLILWIKGLSSCSLPHCHPLRLLTPCRVCMCALSLLFPTLRDTLSPQLHIPHPPVVHMWANRRHSTNKLLPNSAETSRVQHSRSIK